MYFDLNEQTEEEYTSNLPQCMKTNSLVPIRHRMQQSRNHRVLIKVMSHNKKKTKRICTHTCGLEYSHQSNKRFSMEENVLCSAYSNGYYSRYYTPFVNKYKSFYVKLFCGELKVHRIPSLSTLFSKVSSSAKERGLQNLILVLYISFFGLVIWQQNTIWPKNSMDGTLSTICGFREHIRRVK